MILSKRQLFMVSLMADAVSAYPPSKSPAASQGDQLDKVSAQATIASPRQANQPQEHRHDQANDDQ